MQVRNLPARIGAVVRTVDAYPYSLPKGLPDGVEVTVVSYDLKTYNYVVRDAAGENGPSRRCKISTLGVNTCSAGAGCRQIIRSCWQNCG